MAIHHNRLFARASCENPKPGGFNRSALKLKGAGMRIRGDVFWKWADPALAHRSYDETLDDGTAIEVQTRLSRTGATQVFIGVYAASGMPLHEEAFAAMPGESMNRALAWGIGRAKSIANEPNRKGIKRPPFSTMGE